MSDPILIDAEDAVANACDDIEPDEFLRLDDYDALIEALTSLLDSREAELCYRWAWEISAMWDAIRLVVRSAIPEEGNSVSITKEALRAAIAILGAHPLTEESDQ